MPVGRFGGVELDDLEVPGQQVVLRPWRPDDAPSVHEVLRTGELHRFVALPDPYTAEDARRFVTDLARRERAAGTGLDCAVVERGTGRLAGSATLRLPVGSEHASAQMSSAPPAARSPAAAMRVADIGYWIAPSAQGRGLATDATRALARWAYAHGVHRVEVRLDVENLASARVALRSGFGFESVRRDGLPAADGTWRDLAIFARTADDPGDPIAPALPPLPEGGLTDGVLALRVTEPGDLADIVEQEEDPVTVAVGFSGTAIPRDELRRRTARAGLEWLTGRLASFAVVDVATGRYAGSLQLRTVGPPHVGLIGYVVHPRFRGRGYTARALRLLASWAFTAAGFARLELGAKASNLASQRAALSGGFAPDGVRQARLPNADGTFSDEARFALVNPKYR